MLLPAKHLLEESKLGLGEAEEEKEKREARVIPHDGRF